MRLKDFKITAFSMIALIIGFCVASIIYGYLSTKLEREISMREENMSDLLYYTNTLELRIASWNEVKEAKEKLNYVWPIHLDDWLFSGKLTSPFGERLDKEAGGFSDGFHEGSDMKAKCEIDSTWKARIVSVADGFVLHHWINHPIYGKYIIIQHDDGNISEYGHLSISYVHERNKDGTRFRVKKGETILGRMGNTGISSGPHLHFALIIKGKYVNPLKYIKIPKE